MKSFTEVFHGFKKEKDINLLTLQAEEEYCG
jgi:hypothetical protein